MTRLAAEATSFALLLDGIDPHHVASAMSEGIDLHEADGAVWSAQGMSALLALRERAEVIVTLDAVDHSLSEVLLGWGLSVTDQPLASLSEVAVIIDAPPLMLTAAAAISALEAP